MLGELTSHPDMGGLVRSPGFPLITMGISMGCPADPVRADITRKSEMHTPPPLGVVGITSRSAKNKLGGGMPDAWALGMGHKASRKASRFMEAR